MQQSFSEDPDARAKSQFGMKENLYITSWCSIAEQTVALKNKIRSCDEIFPNFAAFIKDLYKKEQISYPKFYKMDNLSKLGFLSAEILVKENGFLQGMTGQKLALWWRIQVQAWTRISTTRN
jgi:hypothetical protein